MELEKRIVLIFKFNGFEIKSELCTLLKNELQIPLTCSTNELENYLEMILENIRQQNLTTPIVYQEHLTLAIRECKYAVGNVNETVFQVINAFDIPKFLYNFDKKKYDLIANSNTLFGAASSKNEYLKNRYMILWQKILRHELFRPTIHAGTATIIERNKINLIESLLSVSKMKNIIIFGLLTQLTINEYFIEDLTGSVKLNLDNVTFHSGLFCDGCFVLAEGNYMDKTFFANGISLPPPETEVNSRPYFETINTWGGSAKTQLKYSRRLLNIEKSNKDASLVFLADCWLDDFNVVAKLHSLFIGYNNFPPTAIILMGPFLKNSDDPYQLKIKLQTFCEILNECDGLKNETEIIFVPSTSDPLATNILPRQSIPSNFYEDIEKKYSHLKFTTNPVRLQYCTQQILICREDLFTKFCRNTIHFPDDKLEDHFSKTIICQGNLAPFTSIVLPVLWEYDNTLLIYPLPDLIVIGDTCTHGFQSIQHGCMVMNCGSFPKSKYSFKVYIPSTKTIEDSQIPD